MTPTATAAPTASTGSPRTRSLLRRPSRWLEALLVLVGYHLLTYPFLPAVRQRGGTFLGEVLVNGIGPDRTGAADYLKHGVFPSWSRDSYGGVPYSANIQHAVWFPGNAPFLFLKTSAALELTVVVTVAFGAWGMYVYCRHALGTRLSSSVLAGLCFGFGGMSLEHIVLTNQLQAIALMPFVLLALHRVLVLARLRDVVLLAMMVGLQLLAGHPEEWVYTLIAVALYATAWAVAQWAGDMRTWSRAVGMAALRVVGAMGLFVALFGIQLYPTMLLKSQSYRESVDFRDQFPLPRGISANSLLPDYGTLLIGENVGFIGVAALLLAAVGLVCRRQGLRWLQIWFVVISLVGFVMALGNADPAAHWAFKNLPLLKSFRVPSRYLLLPTFALAAAAALGLDALLEQSVGLDRRALRDRAVLFAKAVACLAVGAAFALTVGGGSDPAQSVKRWTLAGVAAVLVYVAASVRWIPRVLLALALVVVTTVELQQARPRASFHEVAPPAVYDSSGATLEALDRLGGRYVTLVDRPRPGTDDGRSITVPPGLSPRQAAYYRTYRVTKIAARFNQQSALHVETPLGRDGGLVPLRTMKEFMDRRIGATGNYAVGNYQSPPSAWNFNTLDVLAVRNFVTYHLSPAEAAVMRVHGFRLAGTYDYADVWSRPAPPLARMVYDVDVLPNASARLAALGSMDLTARAIVEQDVPALAAPSGQVPQVRTTLQGTSRVTSRVTTPTRGLLVLGDPAYPQWQVTVDGHKAELLRVDHALQGVVVDAGTHTVEFSYVDRASQLGIGIAVLTGLVLLAVGGVLRRRRPQPGEAPA